MHTAVISKPLVGVLLLALLGVANACEGHDHWNKVIEIKGRRRTLLSMHRRRCGTEPPSPEEFNKVETKLAVVEAKEAAVISKSNATRVYEIKTYVTVVIANDGTKAGDVSDAQIKNQMKMMNDAYSVAAARSGLQWKFKLMDIKRVYSPSMCDKAVEDKVKAKHRRGGASDLNLYFTDLGECGLLGFSTWPWQIKNGLKVDGVVIHSHTLPGGKEAPYNMGRTCIHETGHWFGLYHTFQNGCTRGGDMVADTPFTAGPTEGCPPKRDSCSDPGQDPIHNYMDYSDDNCMHQFTPQQHKRMESQWRLYRLSFKG